MRFIKLLKCLLPIAFMLFFKNGFSQHGDLNFLNISSKEGLSSNVVTVILKDHMEYMWFGTDDGLNKFDGQYFTIYRHKPGDAGSIASNDILDLHEDKLGNLWIGTRSGLVRYDREKDAFQHFKETEATPITSITSDDQGVWVANYEGLSLLDVKTGRFSALKLKRAEDQQIVKQAVLQLYRDRNSRIWLGTRTGLYLYHPKEAVLERFAHLADQPSSLCGNYISAIAEDKQGNLWVGTTEGLSMLMPNGKEFINYHHANADRSSLSSNIVYTIASDPDGKLWIGTEEGLDILEPVKGTISRVERNARNQYSLVGKSVKCVFIDNQGVFWIATFRGGVNKYDKNLAFFHLRQSNPFDPFGLSAPVVTSFAEGEKEGIYVGTDGGGLHLFDPATSAFRHISMGSTVDGEHLSILAMEKKAKEIWMGTYLNGLFIFNTQTGTCRQLKAGTGSSSISGKDIFCLKVDSKGNVWIGTNGEGVSYYDSQKKIFIHPRNNPAGKPNIPLNGYIRAIEEDQQGNIWIGSSGSGIAIYNPLTGSSKILNKINSTLPSDNITALFAGRDGIVWIGTAGGGLTRYAENESLVSFSEENGLANGVVYKILEDHNRKIWLSTNKGISSFDPATGRFKNYSHYNGIQRSPFVLGAGLKVKDGRLFFGGTDGFNYFDPETLHANKSVPRVVLTDLKVSNQSVQPDRNAPIHQHISIAKEIQLDYRQNFSLSFVALNFSSPHENRYFYQLENFDKDWNKVGQSTTAVYTNLDPGDYVFNVKAASDAGEWTTPVSSIKITVRPPFWLSYYAYTLYVAAAVSILLLIRHRGIQKLKARFAIEQERLQVQQLIEQERRESERLHEFDQMKIKFLTNLSHEFRTPISLIMGPVQQLIQQETSDPRNRQLQMIKRNARRLLNLVNQLLDFRNIKEQEQKLQATEGDFIAFAREVAESFKDLADRKRINFTFKSHVGVYFTFFDPNKIERILFNLLSNAFKFTLEGGEIDLQITALQHKEGLEIRLADSGIGMEEEVKGKIFDRFFQSETQAAVLNQGSGIGLSIAKEFVKMHEGTIEVESIAGKGSVFILHFPFKRTEDSCLTGDGALLMAHDLAVESKGMVSNLHRPVILLVEDNDDFRFYLKDNLKTFYQVMEASDGKEGWQKVLATHPELVVSDISMPHVSGIELCRKMKADKRTHHIPVLLLTALAGEENQLIGLETGASDYMTKPFNFEILHVKIRNLLTLNQQLKSTYTKQLKVVPPDIKLASEHEKFLGKVLAYIESNLTYANLSVEDLSKHVGMSRGSLYTKILELTGETPVEFIRSVKLDKAAILLEKSDLNVAQVCYAVGFATPNYFARAFKARFHMLPSTYINQKRKIEVNQKSVPNF